MRRLRPDSTCDDTGVTLAGASHVRRSVPYLAATVLYSLARSQFAFVLPWMVIARGGSAGTAILSIGCGYVPYLVLAPVAGLAGERRSPRLVIALPLLLVAGVTALYPALAIGHRPPFALVYLAAVAFGAACPFVDAGVFRAIAVRSRSDVIRVQALRSTLGQAAGFGGPALGLLLFDQGGADAVCSGIAVALVTAAACAGLGTLGEPGAGGACGTATLRDSLRFAGANRRLRRILVAVALWNLVAGAAFSLVSPLLAHAGLSSKQASVVFVTGAAAVVLVTFPLVRAGLARMTQATLFAAIVAVEGAAFAVFSAGAGPALFALYGCFVIANSVAASTSSSARALAIRPGEQALLNVVANATSSATYLVGVLATGVAAHILTLRPLALLVATGLVVLGLSIEAGRRHPLSPRQTRQALP